MYGLYNQSFKIKMWISGPKRSNFFAKTDCSLVPITSLDGTFGVLILGEETEGSSKEELIYLILFRFNRYLDIFNLIFTLEIIAKS